MTPARREVEIVRIVTEHPGWSSAQVAYALTMTDDQVGRTLLVLRNRGTLEEADGGWRRRRSEIRSWSRHV